MLHTVLWFIIALLVALWILGLLLRTGRCFIHVLLVIALIVLCANVFSFVFHLF